jgi:hypothetical protein
MALNFENFGSEFLNLDWCNRARYKDHMVIASRVFGMYVCMYVFHIHVTS